MEQHDQRSRWKEEVSTHGRNNEDRLLLALHIQRKREFLLSLAEQLEELRYKSPTEVLIRLAELPREIRSTLRDFDHLTKIEQQVEEFTSDFSRKLRKNYPELSLTEVKVCIYIHAGLNNSQIAAIQFVTTRAIEKHRKSIRDKLKLPAKADIQEFLEALGPAL